MAEKKLVVNCATGNVTEVELTPEEIAQRAADAAAKQALLDKLGITADEAKLLLS